jgi:hypothetical protein
MRAGLKIDPHRPHDEPEDRSHLPCMDRTLMNAERTQKLGPATLEKPQIGCVINRAGKIRVLVIHTNEVLMRRQRSILFRKQAKLRRRPRRLGEAEMPECMAGQNAATRRPLQKSLLDQERLDDFFNRVARLR